MTTATFVTIVVVVCAVVAVLWVALQVWREQMDIKQVLSMAAAQADGLATTVGDWYGELFDGSVDWKVVDYGRWQRADHITLGESRAVVKVARMLALPSCPHVHVPARTRTRTRTHARAHPHTHTGVPLAPCCRT